jgi:hypothetical protein
MSLLAMSSLEIVDAFDIQDEELVSALGRKSIQDSD